MTILSMVLSRLEMCESVHDSVILLLMNKVKTKASGSNPKIKIQRET